jgi:hypothetical protein
MMRKELLIVLVILCLAAVLLAAVPVSSLGTYDPWLDSNGDGKIDLKDVFATNKAYGTSGDPTT